MESYKLISEVKEGNCTTVYFVDCADENWQWVFIENHHSIKNRVLIGRLSKETKRGYTVRCFIFNNAGIKIFLPREEFRKVYDLGEV